MDEPALEWLGRQRGKKYWICDGIVTGNGDRTSGKLSKTCLKLRDRHKIVQITSIRQFVELMESGKLKKYRMPKSSKGRLVY